MVNQNDSIFPNEQVLEWQDMENMPGEKTPFRYGIAGGLTIRQHFAGIALQGLTVDSKISASTNEKNYLVKLAVEYSDLLIAELNKNAEG